MSRLGTLGARLYRGDVSYEFVNKRKVWYALSVALLVISIGSLLIRGLTLGIEFKGGAEFRVTSPTATEATMLKAVNSVVGGEVVVQRVGNNQVRAQTEKLTSAQLDKVQQALVDRFGVTRDSIDTQFIGPSWGKDVSTKALRALLFFLLGVVIFLSLYFEPKMAGAAMVALIHDLIITAGIYSLVGFEVTPATVIGFLTILGYSLYDTVVVFDKVRENTAGLQGGSRMTYSQAANLALNQTLVRFEAGGVSDAATSDALTRDVVRRVQEDGTCWLSGTTWHGMAAMRISVSNWATTDEDVERSADAIIRCYEAARAG